MSLTTPTALILLILIPFVIYIGWPRSRFRRTRDVSSLAVRVTIVTLLVLALAGVQVVQSADRLAVVFLVDVSDSMSANAQEAAVDYIEEALTEMRPDDSAGVVTFAADAQVARSMSSARELGPIRTTPESGNTDLAAAVRLGLAMLPGDAARRIVVLSDGLATVGDTDAAAQLAAAAGVEISYVPYSRETSPEVLLTDYEVPERLDEDQTFDMTVTIAADQETSAQLRILSAGQIIAEREVDLRAGEHSYVFSNLVSGSSGFRDWQVQIEPLGADGFYQNNALSAFSQVEGTPRVLIAAPGGGESPEVRYIVPALEESGLDVDVVTPDNLPLNVVGLTQYESVVLANVSAIGLSNARMNAIETYVSDLGGGLVVIGGPDAYGPGGYYLTPLEDVLPVEVQIRDQQRLPQLTIAYVIDRSGSMGMSASGGVANIELAKEAIIRSIDFLQPTDRAGIVTFDFDAYWLAPLQDVFDRREIQRIVATLRSSGGTSIINAMQLVAQDIVAEESERKHVILLTDGGANSSGLVELSRRLNEESGVTTSVISVGQTDPGFLEDMAQAGDGNFHNVVNPEDIPNIFTIETVLATRSYIQEEQFAPTLTAVHPIMRGITSIPPLEGYVAATPRTAAQVVLRGPDPFNDPVLAAWQYGLGRSVAFMSDATARWGQNWVSWGEFTRFWSQAVRWTITEGASNNLETRVVMEDEQARIIVDARNDDGDFLNGETLTANVVHSLTRTSEQVALRQVAPGRYEATFDPGEEGAYLINVSNPGQTLSQRAGWVMSYSPEYLLRDRLDPVLEPVAELTGGRSMADTPEAPFTHDIDAAQASVPLWPWLLLVATLLLPFDIAIRRLLVTRSDFARLSAWARGRFQRQRAAEAAPSERLSSLREARDRARQRTAAVEAEDGETQAPPPFRTPPPERRPTPEPRQSQPAEPPPAEPAKPRYTRPAAPEAPPASSGGPSEGEGGNIGSRLLKRRRGQQNDDDEK